MKYSYLVCLFVLIVAQGIAQETIYGSIQHDGLDRSYILYVPESYNEDDEVPLVFNFHGYGSNANQQMSYGDFRALSDQHGFILVHPEGELLAGVAHWNVGGWTVGSTIDDVGFTVSLIDQLALEYKIDAKKIYSTGMSNGGYMSFLLACQASDRFAAIASVTGSMTPEIYNNCNPSHPTPMLQIHGTEDAVVPYGGAFWTKSIDEVMEYWVAENACQTEPSIEALPDNDTSDGSTVEKVVYADCENNVQSIHYKVTGGGHTWPGTIVNLPGTNQDFNASEVIWDFFSSYDLDGPISTSTEEVNEKSTVAVSPNPVVDRLKIKYNDVGDHHFAILSIMGEEVLRGSARSGDAIDVSVLSEGIYILVSEDHKVKFMKI